jgi:hypothetical protein
MTGLANDQASLEAILKDEIIRMYQEVADQPESTFHFFHGGAICSRVRPFSTWAVAPVWTQ